MIWRENKTDKLTYLYDDAQQNGIYIIYCPLGDMPSIIAETGNRVGIGLNYNVILSTIEELYRLAHEVGHYHSGTYYKFTSSLQIRGQMEYRADAWMVNFLIPLADLRQAIDEGYSEVWELAEYFNVPESVVLRAAEIYRNKGLL
jgi:hypothetical protein